MADLLWETLTSYDNVRGTVIPALAEKWTAADGYRTWQFELDPDATFSSGRPVTADDVVFTLRRVANDSQRSLFSSELMSLMKPGTTGGTIADDAVEATGARSVTVRELILAYRVEAELTKDEILHLYLNHINFGQGRSGVFLPM